MCAITARFSVKCDLHGIICVSLCRDSTFGKSGKKVSFISAGWNPKSWGLNNSDSQGQTWCPAALEQLGLCLVDIWRIPHLCAVHLTSPFLLVSQQNMEERVWCVKHFCAHSHCRQEIFGCARKVWLLSDVRCHLLWEHLVYFQPLFIKRAAFVRAPVCFKSPTVRCHAHLHDMVQQISFSK